MSGPKNLLPESFNQATANNAHRPGEMVFKGIANIADGEGLIAEPRAVFDRYYEDRNGRIKSDPVAYNRQSLANIAGQQRAENLATFLHNEEQFKEASAKLNQEINNNKRMGLPHSHAPVIMNASEFKSADTAATHTSSTVTAQFAQSAGRVYNDAGLLKPVGSEMFEYKGEPGWIIRTRMHDGTTNSAFFNRADLENGIEKNQARVGLAQYPHARENLQTLQSAHATLDEAVREEYDFKKISHSDIGRISPLDETIKGLPASEVKTSLALTVAAP